MDIQPQNTKLGDNYMISVKRILKEKHMEGAKDECQLQIENGIFFILSNKYARLYWMINFPFPIIASPLPSFASTSLEAGLERGLITHWVPLKTIL